MYTNQLQTKINKLPAELKQQVMDYIDFLLFKKLKHKSDDLYVIPKQHLASIKKGLNDIKKGKTIENDLLKKEMQEWFAQK